MAREIDVRTAEDRTDDGRRRALHAAAEEVSDALAGDHGVHVASFDSLSGNAAVISSTAADRQEGDFVARALAHLQRIGPVLGLADGQPPEYLADPEPQTTSSGAVAVHLRQAYHGIPIYDAAETVRFDPDGRLQEVAGRSFTVAGHIAVEPSLSAEQALREAADYLVSEPDGEDDNDPFGQSLREPVLDLTAFRPVVRTVGADRPDLVTSFDAPPFPHAVSVALLWFPLEGGLRLAWHLRLQLPEGPVYRMVVDAGDGRILLCRRLTRAIVGRAEVVLDAGQPRRAVTFPLPLDTYGAPVPADLPAGFPDPWLLDRSTRGASVRAVLADTATPVQGSAQGADVVFPPPNDEDGPEQLVVNLFALCGVMHDVLYLLGFRESDGNFQLDNHGRGGRQTDPVLARVHPGPVWGTANMGTPADGSAPVMNMGLVSTTNRHTALDPDVVYHEYTHGLTGRLVGGPMNDTALDAEQSGGMGEGWSDFIACIVLRKTVVGDWVVSQPTGIRRFPYDDQFPDTFADLGTGRYLGSRLHNLGEIWCATLMSLARRLGAWPTAQIVVDGLKLTAANPSFLAARDAILLAGDQFSAHRGDTPAVRADLVHTIWEVFARYGMGPAARSDGAMVSGIVADFEVPPRPSSTSTVRASATGIAIPDNDPVGILSSVSLPDAGQIIDLAVTVDITHPYRGDLVVALDAPDRQRVTLHQRTGAGANDLRRTWRSQDHRDLARLRGSRAGGTYALHVVDRAPADVGRLNTWTIEADVGDARAKVAASAEPGLPIPGDGQAGVASELTIDTEGTLSALGLDVVIARSAKGDLEVTLTGPDGRTVKVHDRTGGRTANLLASYGSADDDPLRPFVGTPANGTWTLTVVARSGTKLGELKRWSLRAEL